MRQTSIPVLHAERFTGQVDEPTLFQVIRRQRRVPTVLLGRREAQQILSLDPDELAQATKRDCHPVVKLDVDGETLWARISEFARDHYGKTIWHVERLLKSLHANYDALVSRVVHEMQPHIEAFQPPPVAEEPPPTTRWQGLLERIGLR